MRFLLATRFQYQPHVSLLTTKIATSIKALTYTILSKTEDNIMHDESLIFLLNKLNKIRTNIL